MIHINQAKSDHAILEEIRDREIFVGVSSCLLGQRVRYDGDHRLDENISELLGRYFTFLPLCPEIEVGMSVPREIVRLEGVDGALEAPRMVGTDSGEDWTDRMNLFSANRVARSDVQNLSGFILKAKSPSCGPDRVKLYDQTGTFRQQATGLFANALRTQFPDLPIEAEASLAEADLREKFVERVLAYHRRGQPPVKT